MNCNKCSNETSKKRKDKLFRINKQLSFNLFFK